MWGKRLVDLVKKLVVVSFLLCCIQGCSSTSQPEKAPSEPAQLPALLPQPRHLKATTGFFQLHQKTRILVDNQSPEVLQVGQFLSEALAETTGQKLSVFPSSSVSKGIILKINPNLEVGPEGYWLSVTPQEIVCEATTAKGLFWGAQTLRQLLVLQRLEQKISTTQLALPALEIKDEPAFAWRGFMLDVSRHFYSPEFIKRYIDLFSFYKLNVLHLHLSDDQGWRVEVPGFPKLTQVGAWRQEPDGSRHGGFYTAADIKDLVAYAQRRQVTLVPEIDVPGHVQAALAAYPELSCAGGPFAVSTKAGVHPDILCAGNEMTYAFLEAVFSQVANLFLGQYIHLGGDEAPKERWRACPKCQQRMKAEGLADEEALQAYFTRRVTSILQRLHKKAVAWDEVLQGGIGAEVVVQDWHGAGAVQEATRRGAVVISSPRNSFYFDLNSGITSLEKVYNTSILPAGLAPTQQQLVLGAEVALWTEVIPQEKADAMAFPRIFAFAENVWRNSAQEPYAPFQERVRQHYPYLDLKNVTYGFETGPVKVTPTYSPATGTFSVSLQPGLPGVDLRYTLDGTQPTLSSSLYTGEPIQFGSSATLKVVPFKGQQPWHEPVEAAFVKHQAMYKAPVLVKPYHATYSGGGPLALTDGILANEDYRKGFWQGFEREDLEAVLDLGQEREVTQATIRFLQDVNSWIFLPTQVEFYVAGNDQRFQEAGTVLNKEIMQLMGPARIEETTQVLPKRLVRYLKIKAKNVGVCPPGHPGAGGAAWLMADEIIVQ